MRSCFGALGVFLFLSGAVATRAEDAGVIVASGTHIPLTLINSVSTKHSAEGDRVYLQTAFPIMADGRIAIPPGSYVMGTLTHLKKPGRVKGRGELFLRFDSLTLTNGVVRDFSGRISALDGEQKLDHTEGMVKGAGNIGGDARTIGEAAGAGAAVGVLAGSASKAAGMGAAAGASAGALVGVLGVLLSRGPDAVLSQGTTIEMVLDRPVTFQTRELDFSVVQPLHMLPGAPAGAKTPAPARPRLPF